MKKLSLIAALMALVFLIGCAELVFVRDAELYRVKDNGQGLQQIIPTPAPGSGTKFHRPVVNHNGDKVAFIAGTSNAPFGTLWTMGLDGSSTRQINLDGSVTIVVRWYPDDDQYIAYFGQDTSGNPGICRVQTGPAPANGPKICDTGQYDNLGFDINKPQNGPYQVIFARREPPTRTIPKLYWRQVAFAGCAAANPVRIPPFRNRRPDGSFVPENQIEETYPVVSFSQEMLASAVKWSNFIGIRLRAIGQDGTISLPATFQLEGFTEITGLSFSDDDLKIYLSALVSGENRLYYIGLKEILEGLSNLLTLSPDAEELLVPGKFNPKRIPVPAGGNVWSSGINKP